MIVKLPIISSPVKFRDIARGVEAMRHGSPAERFRGALGLFTGSKHICLTNSGISSFYILLKALSRISAKREIILPAYTAGSLVVAVRKAGLKPVLCDISLKDLGLESASLTGIISDNTLAVVCVHSFGINARGIGRLRAELPRGVFLIEDCAQSMGSKTGPMRSGSFSDAAFFSFNRGKNLPLSGGGFISTNDDRIAAGIREETGPIGEESLACKLSAPLKALAFSIAATPVIYGAAFGLISRFKETAPPEDFTVKKMNDFQAALGLTLLPKSEDIFSGRYQNGMALIDGLKNVDGLILPEIPDNDRYVFNRLPLLFKDPAKRGPAARKLWAIGVEASMMYLKPLHRMFDLGYAKDEFPNAVYCADRLLTLPTHSLVNGSAIARIVKVIKEVTV